MRAYYLFITLLQVAIEVKGPCDIKSATILTSGDDMALFKDMAREVCASIMNLREQEGMHQRGREKNV